MDDLDLLLSPDISKAAEASANPPDFATIAQRGARRRRHRTMATVLVAAASVAALLGSLQLVLHNRPIPAVPPSTTVTTTTPNPLRTGPAPTNGPITSAEKYLAGDAGGYQWRSFDAATDKGLFVSARDNDRVESITVVGTHGPLATLTCGRDLHCSPDQWLPFAAALGPGADEVTIESSGDRTVQVVAYDGSVRRTLDLGATLPRGDTIWGLSWSPDGSRLAVLTSRTPNSGDHRDIWLVDAGGAGRRAHSARIWALGPWSPDGQSLLVDQIVDTYGADVVRLRLWPDGSPSPVTAQTLARSSRHFDWAGNLAWSPDGTRIAMRMWSSIDEISPEDGTLLARHPHIDGWLIWPKSGQ